MRINSMPQKEQRRDILTEKRARALATMLLSRREDLHVEEVNQDIGLDFIVRFHTPGKEGLREFGIELRAAGSAVTKDHADKVLLPAVRQVQRYGPFLQPVCLFFFTMENDQAWYTWVAAPLQSEDGKPRLRSSDQPDCQPLDTQALNEIIERVDLWYDAIFSNLVVNGPTGNKNGGKRAKR
jgi:hypothetical protein